MSEKQNHETEEKELTRVEDGILLSLIFMTDEQFYSLEASITLNIRGSIISGTLISRDKYYDLLAKELESSGSETAKRISDHLMDFNKMSKEREEKERKEKEKNSLPNFIHLKDAKFFSPGIDSSLPKQEGLLWRGRLDSIDGFSLVSIR
ncbi:gas vesicle accessory protein GvpU [Cytobacillus praedii]|uniref:gas vesicle accessory protein GvpU n=1 Tax=Cytobacillus praedii TaxID=1742358 RepID=UPI002E23F16F|nr:gas vesicle accessory protein GvpU [Cytobacillus praedii]MED3571953.1 hypothetical protein [Cytobacillus praedii]